jgi:hypothetical protein
MAFPAQNFEDAVSNAITSSDQLYNVINGTSTDVIATDSGDIPSLRKSLVDNFFFLDPIDWLQGENSTKFNQLYKFTDGLLWYAPAATVTNPIPLGASPNGDANWLISPFSITTPVAPIQHPRQFGDGVNVTFTTPSSVFVQPSSVIVRLDGVYQSSLDDYTVDNDGNVVFTSGVPATGVFVDITLYDPVVTENPSELNILATGSTTPRMLKDRFADVSHIQDFGAVGDGVTDNKLVFETVLASDAKEIRLPTGDFKHTEFRAVSEKSLIGNGRLHTTISKDTGSVLQRVANTELQDFKVSDVTIKGGGKNLAGTVGIDLALPSAQMKNQVRNEYKNFAVREANEGILSNSGWNTLFQNYRVTDCNFGYRSLESWTTSWAGSGNTSINGYYAACNRAIDTTSQWNMCFINTIVEYNETPIYERGNDNTYINTWSESNTDPIEIWRGSVFINGRGLEFDLTNITAVNQEEALTWINNSGVKVIRDTDQPALWANGRGVVDFRGRTDGHMELKGRRVAFTGSGQNPSIGMSAYTGATSATVKDETRKVAECNLLSSADAAGYYGRVVFSTGQVLEDGTSPNFPYREQWEVRFDGDFRPRTDGLNNIGSGGARVDTIHLINAPSVTSDERLKTPLEDLTPALQRVAKRIKLRTFKYLEAIERKGETNARIHVGVGAQSVIENFASEGLDAMDFACIRKVEWKDEDDVAQWRYEVVYEELLALKLAIL